MSNKATIGFSEEQAQLQDIAASFCRDKSPVEKVRALLTDEKGYDPDVWNEIAELGWLAIAVPEDFGGIGLGLAEVVPVVEQMGRALMATPFAGTTLAAQALVAGGTGEQQAKLLPDLCTGTVAALALSEPHADWDLTHIECTATREGGSLKLAGRKTFVENAAAASWIIASVALEGKPALVLIDRSSLPDSALRRETVIDETRRSYQVTLDGIEVAEDALLDPSKAEATLAHLHLCASLLLAAEMCGGAASCIDYTVDYLQTRKQFGKYIGSYQALKHPIVDAHVAYEQARSHLYSAAHNFTQQGEGEIATRMAKAQAGEALSFAADRAIQFHGGFGFTYDCDAQLYRRRSLWCENQHGDAVYHRAKLADLML
ncbi:MAG: acyl-CoA dehydrogenase family protein [Parvibaculaceae bacterium]